MQVAVASRIALGLSWVLLIAAEVIASSSGLGWLIWDARNFGRVDEMVAGMFAVGLLGYASDVLVQHLARRAMPWRYDFSGA
jgi:sulfonate transport system permease protein